MKEQRTCLRSLAIRSARNFCSRSRSNKEFTSCSSCRFFSSASALAACIGSRPVMHLKDSMPVFIHHTHVDDATSASNGAMDSERRTVGKEETNQ